MEKNSVRNLQYGPKTRLIRGMYCNQLKRNDSVDVDLRVRLLPFQVPDKKKEQFHWFCMLPFLLLVVVGVVVVNFPHSIFPQPHYDDYHKRNHI